MLLVLNGKLYAIGGVGLSSVEVLIHHMNWSAGVALPSEVNHGTAITVNGKIYLSRWSEISQSILIKCFALIHHQSMDC